MRLLVRTTIVGLEKKSNLNQHLQTCSSRILTSATNTDKHSEVEKYYDYNKNLSIHQQQNT